MNFNFNSGLSKKLNINLGHSIVSTLMFEVVYHEFQPSFD